jgi:hypothetical protein
MSAYSTLSAEQKNVVINLIAYAKREKRPDIFLTSAVFTGLREQSLHNLPGGSGTSQGWRQEIEGKGTVAQRLSLAYSIPHYYRECAEIYRPGMPANELAERVQRPEKPYPEQAQTLALAEAILKSAPGVPSNFAFGPAPSVGTQLQPVSSIVIVAQPDPKDRSAKIRASGQKLGASGTSFEGHTKALRDTLTKTVKLSR